MTFVDAFYSFALEISDADRSIYTSLRVKTPKHPNESLEHLAARIFAYLHSYQEGLSFSRGLFEVNEPTIWKKDCLDDILLWIQVGHLPFKKLVRALKQCGQASFRSYFYEEQQAESFIKDVKGRKINWAEKSEFYMIDFDFLTEAASLLSSSNRLETLIADNHLYITLNDIELNTYIIALNSSQLGGCNSASHNP